MKKKRPKKYKNLKIKLYENQFEVWQANEKEIGGTAGCFQSEKKSEVLVAMAIFIDTYMRIRKDRPLIVSIEEGIFMPVGSVEKPS